MTPLLKGLLKTLKLDTVYGCDFETYWADDFTLSKLATTDYIYDPRFEAQIVSVQSPTWAKPKVMEAPQFRQWAATVDWSRTGFLAHNTAFDGLIASKHFGIKPAFYFDTLSMAKPIMPVSVGGSLKALCEAFKRPSKLHQDALISTKGKRWAEFTRAEKVALKTYAGDDIEDCWFLFHKLLPYVPINELRLIDQTLKMYAQPRVLLDKPMLLDLANEEVARKQALMDRLGLTPEVLQSNNKFATLLESYGVDPPKKASETTGEETWAFSKTDLEFKALLEHENEDVQALMEARFGVKSTMVETRAFKFAARADYGPQPVYLNYCGANTMRWSGGDGVNFQNLKRGSPIRSAIYAPRGYTFVIADLSQIEARLNAWFAGQQDVVDAFARGEDVYSITASEIFGRKVTKADTALRFVGKTADLGLGYGAGAPKFRFMLQTAQGPADAMKYAASLSESAVRDIHRGWRQARPFIVANWKATEKKFKSAALSGIRVDDACVAYEGKGENAFMHSPNGNAIRYSQFSVDENGEMSYVKKFRRNKVKPPTIQRGKLYGGLLVENRTQHLAREVIAFHMLEASGAIPGWQMVMSTHDEIVGLVPTRQANRALKVVTEIMSTPPAWAVGLPLAVEAHISGRYDK